MTARLLDKYRTEVAPALTERFGYRNPMSVPKLRKVVVSMGIGDGHSNPAKLEAATKQLALITGQQPVVTKARQAISNFRLRKGFPVGLKVTLRGARMYEFLDRLINLAMPRFRDFRGLDPGAFDGRGNYNLGVNEQLVFPEVRVDKVQYQQGMNITIVIQSSRSDEESRVLLEGFGFPFRREQ